MNSYLEACCWVVIDVEEAVYRAACVIGILCPGNKLNPNGKGKVDTERQSKAQRSEEQLK